MTGCAGRMCHPRGAESRFLCPRREARSFSLPSRDPTAFSAAMATLNMAAFYQRAGHVALSRRDVEMVVHCLRLRRRFLRRRPDAIASTGIGEAARISGEDEHPPDGADRIFRLAWRRARGT